MATTAIAAIGLFAATNIDDIVIVTLFFLAVGRGALRTWQVVAGQYLGVGALVGLSLLAAWGLEIIPDRWVGVLGLIPLALGIRGLVAYLRSRSAPDEQRPTMNPGGLLGVTGVTLANGGDNIAVYTPVFRTMSAADTTLTVIIFFVLIGVWLVVGRLIGSRQAVLRTISVVEPWLVPAVYCVLGLVILAGSGTVTHIFG